MTGQIGLVVMLLDFPEVNERRPSSAGLAKSTVVAVVWVYATVGVRQKPVVCDVVQAVGAVEGGGDRYGYREALREPDACRAFQGNAST